ncbi:carbonic anhydrase [Alkanindiges sp. WGS2144]|uniref:carbonic anhydrase n=1 Tax=Alkanindiges sp. WGS2144 TaxID=3366808 RepID=UPI003752765F
MISAQEALERLKQGNKEFVEGKPHKDTHLSLVERATLAQEQHPFAVILGCSDSRVPAEIIFNQGLGDLFVIRVAGNIVAPSQVGSVEFAAEYCGTPLVVVLGHSHCGAIQAAIDALRQPNGKTSRSLMSIVNRVRPSVEILMHTELRHDLKKLSKYAVRANVQASVNQLRHGSAMLEQMILKGQIKVVGAEYAIETGEVEFFDM